ncbi:MAG: murein biosynthesis integral membrane protein MurJ, partial [Acidimicrobiales bacterium]
MALLRAVSVAGSSRLVKANLGVALGTAISRATGLVRVAVVVHTLGLTRLADAYNVPNTAPNLIYELLVGGVLSATLLPVFVDQHERRDARGESAIVNAACAALIVIAGVGMIAAPALASLFVGRISGLDPTQAGELRSVMTVLLRLLLPQIVFYGLMTLGASLLYARRVHLPPNYTPILNNLVVITAFATLPLVADLDPGDPSALAQLADRPLALWWIGLGTTLGVAAQALALWPYLRRHGVRWLPVWAPNDEGVRAVVRLSGWTVGYVAANQLTLLMVLALAADGLAGGGGPSAYQLAFVFFQLPHGLLAVSLMTTFSPELTRLALAGDHRRFAVRFRHGLRLVLFLMLPASAALWALARPLVALLPIGGNAPEEATAGVVAAFAFGLAPFSAYLYTLRGFYAFKDTRTPFFLNLAENAVNVAAALALVGAFGVRGLAGAYSLAYAVAAVAALRALSRRIPGLGLHREAAPFLRLLAAALALAGVARFVLDRVGADDAGLRALLGAAAGAAAGG